MAEIFLYAICALLSTFAVSGMNLNGLFKQGHVWEARIFLGILIAIMTYLLEQFCMHVVSLF